MDYENKLDKWATIFVLLMMFIGSSDVCLSIGKLGLSAPVEKTVICTGSGKIGLFAGW